MSEWKRVKLGDVAFTRNGAGIKQEAFSTTGVPLARVSDFTEGSIDLSECIRIDIESAKRWSSHRLTEGEAIVATVGSWPPNWSSVVGKVVRVPREAVGAIQNQNTCCVLERPNISDQRFLFYLLKDKDFVHYAANSAAGSANQARLPVANLERFEFLLPSLEEQRTIAAVLGALDDKIDLNRRMNATLEAMARALFQSWFVDFDPVRSKLDGRPPVGIDTATAAIFPDTFDETALGHTPHGWKVQTLGEVIKLAYGKPLKAEDRKTGPVCVYGANGPVGWHDEKLVSGPGIVVGRKGTPGVVTWAHGDFYPIDTTFYVEPIGECRSLYYFYYALSLHNFANLSADSAVPGLNRNHAYMSKQVIPPQPVLAAFDSQIAPMFTAIHANEEQSRTLATLRGTLLPKLLSGRLTTTMLASRERHRG